MTPTPRAPREGGPLGASDVLALARSGALLLGAGIIVRLLEWFFSNRPILPVVIGAFLLDLWSRFAGTRWMPGPHEGPQRLADVHWFRGVGVGLAIGFSVLAVGVATGAARIGFGGLGAVSVAMGGVRVAVYAFRDELLYRGIPLALVRDRVPAAWAVAFSVLLSVAPLASYEFVRPEALFLSATAAAFFALTWKIGPGGLSAWSAHTGWLFAVEIVQGGPLDVEWTSGRLSATDASGFPAYVGAAVFGVTAFLLYGRRRAAPA